MDNLNELEFDEICTDKASIDKNSMSKYVRKKNKFVTLKIL